MSKKEEFIEWCREAEINCPMNEDAVTFFAALCGGQVVDDKPPFTQNGIVILNFMRDNKSIYNNLFKAKDFEGAGLTSRQASGAMRKLVTDGYVEKLGANPIMYALTSSGETVELVPAN